ncbi:hypothetical protein AVEN_44537-1 [Araneus ventricosus]|uniref:Uncharacterized protein n=1 Tax=Araneus ventricosus TaxID=182803 RepID=A0A4Y2F9D3_ARAVE|nr:hypothetical protein AVEN_44537-1 [Araneus ventricosus]
MFQIIGILKHSVNAYFCDTRLMRSGNLLLESIARLAGRKGAPEQTPRFQLHKILWVAVSSTLGLRVERRHHLQSVCLQDVVLVDQTDENRLGLSLVNILEAHTLLMMTFNTKSYCG